MRFISIAITATLAAFAAASGNTQKAVLVSYENNTPQSVVDKAMEKIREAGGVITHEYTLLKGFAANCPTSILDSVKTMGMGNNIVIEDDKPVSINGGSS